MNYSIEKLPREKWQDHVLPIGYVTDEYYDVSLAPMLPAEGCTVKMERRHFDAPVVHSPEEYDFPDKLYAPYWEDAEAFGIIEGGRLLAAIETCSEEWSNRLRITELWVDASLRRQGVGHALIEIARDRARREKRRALILETQSCNVNAIGFYLHEGFGLIGFDACCYANNDLERKEVRLEFGILF